MWLFREDKRSTSPLVGARAALTIKKKKKQIQCVHDLQVSAVAPIPQIDVLPEVVQAVGGRVEVFMDGGVRQGTDVLKALAMGAKAVFVGRPVLWGLVYNVSEHVVIMISL